MDQNETKKGAIFIIVKYNDYPNSFLRKLVS